MTLTRISDAKCRTKQIPNDRLGRPTARKRKELRKEVGKSRTNKTKTNPIEGFMSFLEKERKKKEIRVPARS